jgi:uncharacterized membrane protein YdbT with pleckstrin-like domain
MKWNNKDQPTEVSEEYSEKKIEQLQKKIRIELRKQQIEQKEQSLSSLEESEKQLLASIENDLALLEDKKKRKQKIYRAWGGFMILHLIVYLLLMSLLATPVHDLTSILGKLTFLEASSLTEVMIWLAIYMVTWMFLVMAGEDIVDFSYYTEDTIRRRLEMAKTEIEQNKEKRLALLDTLMQLKKEGEPHEEG